MKRETCFSGVGRPYSSEEGFTSPEVKGADCQCVKMEAIDREVYYVIEDRCFLDAKSFQQELLPEKLHQLRWRLSQKAKKGPKFRIYALFSQLHRRDVLADAWKRVGKDGKHLGWKRETSAPEDSRKFLRRAEN